MSSAGASDAPVGVLMMNMGGPQSLDGVEPFLRALFEDGEIIRLGPLQSILGPWIARRRAPRIRAQYASIGGASPIGRWTSVQGAALEAKLAGRFPGTRFKAYTAFRYAPPLTAAALEAMAADGVTRAIAFSQYPHFSCTTTGSSLNHLWRESVRLGLESRFSWSVIDRWPLHAGFLAAVARNVTVGLQRFPPTVRDRVVVLFSAHSVPMLTVNKGDQYVQEVAATVSAVVEILRKGGVGGYGPVHSPYILAWQSKVGFLPWMGPSTASVLEGLAKQGHKYVLTVPIAFTSDHIETLFEIDQEYAEEAKKAGISQFERAPSLNGEDDWTTAQADIVAEHFASGAVTATPQYKLNCAGCTNPICRTVLNPVSCAHPYEKLRDAAGADGSAKVAKWPSGQDLSALRALTAPSK